MRSVVWLLALVALAAANSWDEPWVEEEDLAEYNDERNEEPIEEPRPGRTRRYAYVEEPYEEHIRVKRRCYEDEPHRVRRSSDYTRVPRQVHQYEVHEATDEGQASFSSPPFEEMLAASAEHYHRVYAAPGVPVASHVSVKPEAKVPPSAIRSYPDDIQFAPVNMQEHRLKAVDIEAPAQYSYSPPTALPINAASYHPSQLSNHKPFESSAGSSAYTPVPVKTVPSSSYPSVVSQKPNPAQFVGPINVGYVAAGSKAPAVVPVPVASVPVAPVSQLSDGDLLQSAAGHKHHHHHHKHKHGHVAGGGHGGHAHHHGAHGGKSIKGFDTRQHLDKGSKGHKTDEHHKKEYEEASGHKKKHHDKADHKGGHDEEAHGQRGAHFDEKKGHKKGHKTKGFHNKYHKDEFHKEHKFYDDFHKSGEHHRFGKFHAKHASNESGKKKAHHVNAGHDFVERGKKGYSNKGHLDADHKGYKGKHGHEEHHEHHKNHGKKGGSEGGKEWGYAKKN